VYEALGLGGGCWDSTKVRRSANRAAAGTFRDPLDGKQPVSSVEVVASPSSD
jgi:hypothetical protein